MSSTVRCARDGKEYAESETVKIGGVPVAKVNLTAEEKKTYNVGAKTQGEVQQTAKHSAELTAAGAPATQGGDGASLTNGGPDPRVPAAGSQPEPQRAAGDAASHMSGETRLPSDTV